MTSGQIKTLTGMTFINQERIRKKTYLLNICFNEYFEKLNSLDLGLDPDNWIFSFQNFNQDLI